MKKLVNGLCLSLLLIVFTQPLFTNAAVTAKPTLTAGTPSHLTDNDPLNELLGTFPSKTRAYVETVPNTADQICCYGRDWSSLLNVTYRTIRCTNGYDRSFYERRPSTYVFPFHRRYYWAFAYDTH